MTFGPLLQGGSHARRFDPAPHAGLDALAAGLATRQSALDPSRLPEIARRLSEAYRAMKLDQAGLPLAWLPAGEWSSYITQRQPVYSALESGDFGLVAEVFAGFWRNELSPIVKEYANFSALAAGDADPTQRFLHNVVRNWLLWRELTRQPTAALATPNVGDVWGVEIEGVVVAPKACRYHLLASELAGMLAGAEAPVVAEIGGGYGGLAEFLFRTRPDVAWIDYDLPEIAVIAAFFHVGARGDDRIVLYGEAAPPKARSDLRGGVLHVMPNYAIGALGDRAADAVVNMFSLSEVGRDPLDALLERIEAVAGSWFVHHNMDRPGVVNRGFERIPASTFAIDRARLPLVATGFDPFHGTDGDYRWFIHRRA